LVATLAVATVGLLPLAGCGGDDGGGGGGKVALTFSSYAWQKPTVAATKKIVEDWNKANPNVQVEYVQVDPDSVHDKLVTQFGGGSAPDVIHDESADIAGFAEQGYLADLSGELPGELRDQVSQGVWDSVTFDGKVYGVPTLLQSYVIFANEALLTKAGVTPPTVSQPWTWDTFRQEARKLTSGQTSGVAWGLKQPVAAVMSLSLNYNGKFFGTDGDKTTFTFGPAEQQVVRRIRTMIDERAIAPTSVSMSSGDILPGFFAGKYAMVVAGNFLSQQMVEQAPKGFRWRILPPMRGDSDAQAANPQTLSIASQSKHKKEAMDFIAFYTSAQNLASLAKGDWLIPATSDASKAVLDSTKGEAGWDVVLASGKSLTVAPFGAVKDYPQWKEQIATPALQQYFGGKIDLTQLGDKLTSGWEQVAQG
jgi:ABC-type glycerol-3-phosphate transport system substrate-binding protein